MVDAPFNTAPFFPVGATYAPLAKATEVDMAEWDADLEGMKGLGLTTFRLFIAWDRIETCCGQRDWTKVDHAFELAEKHGLKVIANVGGTFRNLQAIYPPRWLHTECGCQVVMPTLDSPTTTVSPRLKLCYDDPTYRTEALAFIRDAVERYREHPALLAWSGWNEPHTLVCYCPHTLALYREWLKASHGSLDSLSTAWSTEFPIVYHDWSEIFPQVETGFDHGGYRPWLDWQRFLHENSHAVFGSVVETIRAADAEHPVVMHAASANDADILGNEDHLAVSLYTYHDYPKSREELSDAEVMDRMSWKLACMNLGYRHDRRDPEGFWVLETEGGPVHWVHGLAARTHTGAKMNARDMLYVGGGARCVLRWLYRSRVTDAQAGEFNIVGWDGTITDRAKAFGELGQFLSGTSELWQTASRPAAEIGIYQFDPFEWAIRQAEGGLWNYYSGANKIFTALRHTGYLAEVFNRRQLLADGLDRYRVVVLPVHPYTDEATAAAFRTFVERGGTLLVETPFAIKNLHGDHWRQTPGPGLDDVFGAQVFDMEQLHESTCAGIPAVDFRAIIRPLTCTVKATFADGKPALTSNVFGQGRAVMFASVFSSVYQWETGAATRAFLDQQLRRAKVAPWVTIETAQPDRLPEIGVQIRTGEAGSAIVTIVNFSCEAHTFSAVLGVVPAGLPELVGVSSPLTKVDAAAGQLALDMEPFGWAVCTIPNVTL